MLDGIDNFKGAITGILQEDEDDFPECIDQDEDIYPFPVIREPECYYDVEICNCFCYQDEIEDLELDCNGNGMPTQMLFGMLNYPEIIT